MHIIVGLRGILLLAFLPSGLVLRGLAFSGPGKCAMAQPADRSEVANELDDLLNGDIPMTRQLFIEVTDFR